MHIRHGAELCPAFLVPESPLTKKGLEMAKNSNGGIHFFKEKLVGTTKNRKKELN